MIVQTACAVLLLVGAGLLVRSFVQVLATPPGFDPERLLVVRANLAKSRYDDPARSKAIHQQVIEHLGALPGVETAGVSSNLPLSDQWRIGFRIEGRDEGEMNLAQNFFVSKEYFRAMGIPILKGRTFTEEDREGVPAVALVGQNLASRYWPGEDVIGKRIGWGDEWLPWRRSIDIDRRYHSAIECHHGTAREAPEDACCDLRGSRSD